MPIFYSEKTKTFYLENKNITYSFFVNEYGYLEHLYFGERIGRDDLRYSRAVGGFSGVASIPGKNTTVPNSYHLYRSELTFYGTGDFREPAVHVLNKEGDRLTELLYISHEIVPEKPKCNGMPTARGGETLIVHLGDRITDFHADLYYTIYDDCDIIARRAVYKNRRSEPIKLTRAYSFALSLPENGYDILTLRGSWANERNIDRYQMHYGVTSIDSKRVSSSATLNPFMAVMSKDADEYHGEVYGFNLVYSSSFVLKCEGINDGQTQITGGINDFDFSWLLGCGEDFETPEVLIAYSKSGLGGMSRAYHDCIRNHVMPKKYAKSPRPIVINNWEATYFDFNTEKLIRLADSINGTGIDTFVLDDGWFGKRDSDTSGLGDWRVNENKLNGGLDRIISHVNSLGMKFGLWFEPEMISEDSDIYREHPEYAISAANRLNSYSRNQFVMDITRADVRNYIVNSVNNILQNHNISYVKWDCNRRVTELYSKELPADRQSEFAHRYALGLYELFERIITANPNIMFEGCAGGGARFDTAMLAYFPQIWTSDDTDANERTKIQYGTSLVYPLSAMSAHISAIPNHQTHRTTPRRSRADIAHLGATGYELDTTGYSDTDREEIAKEISEYKSIEELVLCGDLYRVEGADPSCTEYFGFTIVSKDKSKAHTTLYRRMGGVKNSKTIKRFKIHGLDSNTVYSVPELGITASGITLANVGIPEFFEEGDFKTVTLHFMKA